MQLEQFQYKEQKGQIQLEIKTKFVALAKCNGFVFQVTSSGLELFYTVDEFIAHQCRLPLDKTVMTKAIRQKVMRVEDIDSEGETISFIAINQRLLSKTPIEYERKSD